VELLRVPELGRASSRPAPWAAASLNLPTATIERFPLADALIFGTPTRFGNMSAEMRHFLDRTGHLWSKGALVGKIGSVFTSVGSQHAGHETTITSFHSTLLHHGMLVVGVPSSGGRLANLETVSGGTPYGASTVSIRGKAPTAGEMAIAHFQGSHVAELTARLKRGAGAGAARRSPPQVAVV
jgi:NAD(P)H dehydrogenase (quinone)